MEPEHRDQPHLPAPTLYPVGFAAGIACLLVGLVVSPTVIAPRYASSKVSDTTVFEGSP